MYQVVQTMFDANPESYATIALDDYYGDDVMMSPGPVEAHGAHRGSSDSSNDHQAVIGCTPEWCRGMQGKTERRMLQYHF